MTSPSSDLALGERVGATMEAFLERQAARLAPLGADAAVLLDQARLCLGGGKRLRASFCWWGYRAVAEEEPTGAEAEGLLRACAAWEVLHASALVHDDYMDASATRRGRPSPHVAFEQAHRDAGWPGDARQYGASASILLGDLLLSWADELLRRCGLPADRVSRALDLFDLARSEVVAGQFLDVSVQARGYADVDQAMTVLRYKSAKYSVERPLHVGAALGGADQQLLGRLSAFGVPLGEAFQLRDDQLGVFGDPAATGKPAGDDLVEGKRTVLVALALDAAAPSDAARLESALGTPATAAQIAELRSIITASGASAQVEDAITALTTRALTALGATAVPPAARAALTALADAATQRRT